MNIDSLTQGNQTTQGGIKINTKDLTVEGVKKESKSDNEKNKTNSTNDTSTSLLSTETKLALDKATGLLQSITSDKITDKVIRKMPSDEYLHLLHIMDEIISGSINKKT